MLQDLLRQARPDDVLTFGMGALLVVGGVVVLAIYFVCSNWRKVRQHQLDVALKQDMLDRGMSAADIARVIGSASAGVESKVRQHQLDVALKQDMLDRGMSAADIARVIGSASAGAEGTVTEYPTPGDVVVEWEGDWYPGILLKTDGAKYYVHYKGYDEEEWVTLDRLRFPAQPRPAAAVEPQHAAV